MKKYVVLFTLANIAGEFHKQGSVVEIADGEALRLHLDRGAVRLATGDERDQPSVVLPVAADPHLVNATDANGNPIDVKSAMQSEAQRLRAENQQLREKVDALQGLLNAR